MHYRFKLAQIFLSCTKYLPTTNASNYRILYVLQISYSQSFNYKFDVATPKTTICIIDTLLKSLYTTNAKSPSLI